MNDLPNSSLLITPKFNAILKTLRILSNSLSETTKDLMKNQLFESK